MEFFENMKKHLASFDFTITVKSKGEKITVGIFPEHRNIDVNDRLNPISATGTAEELDEKLFEVIGAPLEKASGIISNIEGFDGQLKKLEEQKRGKVKSKEAEPEKKPAPKSSGKPITKPKVETEDEDLEDDNTPVEVQESLNF